MSPASVRLSCLLVLLQALACTPLRTPTAEANSVTQLERNVIQAVNRVRQERRRDALERHPALDLQAKEHSERMAAGRTRFSHDGSKRRAERLYRDLPLNAVAENIAQARGYDDPVGTAVEGWLKSRGHRRNMLGNFQLTGVGVAIARDGTVYTTQLFGRLSEPGP